MQLSALHIHYSIIIIIAIVVVVVFVGPPCGMAFGIALRHRMRSPLTLPPRTPALAIHTRHSRDCDDVEMCWAREGSITSMETTVTVTNRSDVPSIVTKYEFFI